MFGGPNARAPVSLRTWAPLAILLAIVGQVASARADGPVAPPPGKQSPATSSAGPSDATPASAATLGALLAAPELDVRRVPWVEVKHAGAALTALILGRETAPAVRARAAEALPFAARAASARETPEGARPFDGAAATLRTLRGASYAKASARRAATLGLGELLQMGGLSATESARTRGELRRALDDREPTVRGAGATALSRAGGATDRQRVEARLRVEPHRGARAEMQRALAAWP